MDIKTTPRRRKWLDFHLAPPFYWILIMLFCGLILWSAIQLAGYAVESYFSQLHLNECDPTSTITQAHPE